MIWCIYNALIYTVTVYYITTSSDSMLQERIRVAGSSHHKIRNIWQIYDIICCFKGYTICLFKMLGAFVHEKIRKSAKEISKWNSKHFLHVECIYNLSCSIEVTVFLVSNAKNKGYKLFCSRCWCSVLLEFVAAFLHFHGNFWWQATKFLLWWFLLLGCIANVQGNCENFIA